MNNIKQVDVEYNIGLLTILLLANREDPGILLVLEFLCFLRTVNAQNVATELKMLNNLKQKTKVCFLLMLLDTSPKDTVIADI